MRTQTQRNEKANGLVVVVSVVATILAILGAAVSYTGHISRIAQRSRRTALALEIADGHLEYLFTNWRNIYRKIGLTYNSGSGGTNYAILPTNYFFTSVWNPGPAPSPVPYMTPAATPAPIPTPSKSNFPTEANYNVTQYRIQAVDPMIDLDSSENALLETSFGSGNFTPMPKGTPYASPSSQLIPPPAYGPNTWQYSFYYLAAVDVNVPALGTNSGTVTAKVRRVFEKRFDNPWTYGIFYNDDLELQPTSPLTMNGPIHSNGNLYIGTSNFTAQSSVGYTGSYVNGYSPNDTSSHAGSISAPTFVANLPPTQEGAYMPFGWNLNLDSSTSNNNDSYHEIIERPVSGTDPLANVRYYNQPGYRIVLNDPNNGGNNTVQQVSSNGTITNISGSALNAWLGNNGQGSSSTILQQNQPLYDAREGAAVKVTNFNVNKLLSTLGSNNSGISGWTGLVYVADGSVGTSASVVVDGQTYSTTRRGIRLMNGTNLPTGGLTIVSEDPVYIQGNYNTGGNDPPSNSGTYTDPDKTGYTRVPAAVVADAVSILSQGWNDNNSDRAISSRNASNNTTINAAIVGGIVPSSGGNYSGGGENFIRFLEDWSNKTFCYYGSMVELYSSAQATAPWNGNGTVFKSPVTSRWYYDDATFSNTLGPPGALQIAAYLQQQRWYQVY
jgi:hypothetical protein